MHNINRSKRFVRIIRINLSPKLSIQLVQMASRDGKHISTVHLNRQRSTGHIFAILMSSFVCDHATFNVQIEANCSY